MHPRRGRPSAVLAVLLAGVLVAAIGACAPASDVPSATADTPSPVDPLTTALLAAHDQVATGPTTLEPVTIGDMRGLPWALYLEASQQAGLDFAGLEGAGAELRATPIAGWAPDAKAYVLVRGGVAIGAWIGPGGTSSGVLPLDARP